MKGRYPGAAAIKHTVATFIPLHNKRAVPRRSGDQAHSDYFLPIAQRRGSEDRTYRKLIDGAEAGVDGLAHVERLAVRNLAAADARVCDTLCIGVGGALFDETRGAPSKTIRAHRSRQW